MKVLDSYAVSVPFLHFGDPRSPLTRSVLKGPRRSSVGYDFIGHVNSEHISKPPPDHSAVTCQGEEKFLDSRRSLASG